MPLVLQPDGTIIETSVPVSGVPILVLFEGVVQEAIVEVGTQEVSFPSYIASNVVYSPTSNLEQAGVSVINGRVILDTIIKEVSSNV